MQDFILTLIIHFTVISIIVLLLNIFKKVEVEMRWATISLVLFAGYFAALVMGGELIPINNFFPDIKWNWGGKIAAIALWGISLVTLLKYKKDFKLADAGFTFKQNENSTKPVLFGLVIFVLIQIALTMLFGSGPDYDTEELLFQATMPGLDEEPMFRGIILYTLTLAIVSNRFSILGANINIAGVLIVLLFGLGHGVMYSSGEFTFSAVSLSITGFYGFILLWFRERTGSLVFPIIAHNSVNFVGQFF